MALPKYIRPIRNVEQHGLSKAEMAVRMIIFVPFLVLFSVPRGIAVACFTMLGSAGLVFGLGFGVVFAFFASGLDAFIQHPVEHSSEIFVTAVVVAILVFSSLIAKMIRRYFLPFG